MKDVVATALHEKGENNELSFNTLANLQSQGTFSHLYIGYILGQTCNVHSLFDVK